MLHTILALFLLPALACAQKLVDSANENATAGWWPLTPNEWFCIKRSLNAPMVLTGLQYHLLLYLPTTTPVDYGVFDEDPMTGKPRQLLGSGSALATPAVPGWYGAEFTTRVAITTSGNYFVGIKLVNGVDIGLTTQGTRTPHWWGQSAGWNGPFSTHGWMFRLYADSHAGKYANFGTGQAGYGNVVPEIRGLGWPNTANTIDIQLSRGRAAYSGGLALGLRINLVAPFGTLYALPVVWVPVTLRAHTPAGIGHGTLSLVIPNDASLNGGVVASQGWVFDPAAPFGFAYSGGLEITIGH